MVPSDGARSARTGTNRTVSPGAICPSFQRSPPHDGDRADESAQARPVRAEQDRGVAGEVQSAHAVGVVVNVRRVQAGFAAVGARPLRLGSFESHAGAIGVEVHGVVGADQGLDVGAGEELRCGVRTLGDRDLPAVADGGLILDGGAGGPAGGRTGIGADGQLVALAQGPAAVPAEAAQGEGGCAAEVFGFAQATRHQDVAAHAGTRDHADVQHAVRRARSPTATAARVSRPGSPAPRPR